MAGNIRQLKNVTETDLGLLRKKKDIDENCSKNYLRPIDNQSFARLYYQKVKKR